MVLSTVTLVHRAAREPARATQVHTLARGAWVTAPENLIFAGPIGAGKTHLAIPVGERSKEQLAQAGSR